MKCEHLISKDIEKEGLIPWAAQFLRKVAKEHSQQRRSL
jgi:hypothetical protein